jgi:hypothetical protein
VPDLLRPISLFVALQLGSMGLAWACSCAEPPPVADALAEADQVFYGEVLSIDGPAGLGCGGVSSADPMAVRIEVRDAWKGTSAGETVTVETARDGASCGVDFVEGETWLVYATDGRASLCSRTRMAGSGDDELAELDAL